MKIALTGASGFVGQALRAHFHDTVILDRDDTVETILQKLKGVDAVINLAGAPIIKRWSESYKKTLYDSRILTTRKLVKALNASDVKFFISTSAIGIYPNNHACNEKCADLGKDFLAELCVDWEAEALQCNKPTAIVRFGIVLGPDGGALAQMLPPFKLGLGGPIGKGDMMMSWIHITDLVRMCEYLITEQHSGIYNACSPQPISNLAFTKTLGKVLHRPTLFPLPPLMLKLIFAEGAQVLLDSKEVYPKSLLEKGFAFHFNQIEGALQDILSTK
jgi:uncharacterized protein (TIGR01777 family)